MDNLSHCKSFKKMKKKDRKKEKKVKMLLCTPPSSPVPHPNYFYIRCVHCDIPFPFSFYNDLHNVGPTFHICKIPRFHILWPCKFSWDAGERPCNSPFPQIMLIKGISRAEVELQHPIFRIFTDSDAGENFNKLQHFILETAYFWTTLTTIKLTTNCRKKPSKGGQI